MTKGYGMWRTLPWRVWATLILSMVLSLWRTVPLHGQDLDTADVQVPLDSALRLARNAAATAFPELSQYLLYSVTPRALKGDSRGLHSRCCGKSGSSLTAGG